MTSTFTGMDYHYVSSPSASPQNTMLYGGLYLESTSESSSPSSPHSNQSLHQSSSYDTYQYGVTLGHYPSAHDTTTRIPVTVVSSSLDHKDRRRKRTDSTKSTSDKETIPTTHLRRRAQNRASQRAFRERKEKHVKSLEHQLEELHEKHQDLLQSYSKQVNEVSQLNARIAQLSTELNAVRQCQDPTFNEVVVPGRFDKFDAFPSTDLMYHNSGYFHKGFDLGTGFAIYPLEDSL